MLKKSIIGLALLASAAYSHADFFSDFEAPTYSGSSTGVILTGQDGWTKPSGVDFYCFTYAGNTPGLSQNPNGGKQFAGGISQGGSNLARAEHLNDFGARDLWTVSYDLAGIYTGTLPTADNLSSFSLQSSTTTKSFIALNTWVDINTAQAWNAQYNVYDSAGAALTNQSAGDAWKNLPVNRWFRESTTFDFNTNLIVSVSITDLTTGIKTTVSPNGWYLQGGANSNLPRPTAFRMFAGGNAGNTMGFDNVSVVPEPATLAVLAVGALALLRRKKR